MASNKKLFRVRLSLLKKHKAPKAQFSRNLRRYFEHNSSMCWNTMSQIAFQGTRVIDCSI